jgi:hypothetical protein
MVERPEAAFANILMRWRALPKNIQLQLQGYVSEAVRVAQQALDAYDSNMARAHAVDRHHRPRESSKPRSHLRLVHTRPKGSP